MFKIQEYHQLEDLPPNYHQFGFREQYIKLSE